jgi:anti-anti-sigma factor
VAARRKWPIRTRPITRPDHIPCYTRIIVDLAALGFIDCCALGALGRVRAQARQAGGDLLLAAPRGPVRRILALTGLIDVFSGHASVADAVRIGRPVVTVG